MELLVISKKVNTSQISYTAQQTNLWFLNIWNTKLANLITINISEFHLDGDLKEDSGKGTDSVIYMYYELVWITYNNKQMHLR